MNEISRRGFLASGALAVAGCATTTHNNGEISAAPEPLLGTAGAPFRVGAPCLQAPAETSMGVSWAVSGLAKGVVEYADNPTLANSRIARGDACGLVPIDPDALQVRLTGLKRATRYWYRTITTPFTDYRNIYDAKLGEPVTSPIHSFTTMGAGAKAHFAVMNDTHAEWTAFQAVAAKVRALAPSVTVWNGDATNSTQRKSDAVLAFHDPPIDARDYAADTPVAFESGNHDFRGSWISRKEEVMMPRESTERTAEEQALKWNFAFRLGDLALIGMDTGEDKPDEHPKWFGLANFTPYRRAQTEWLARALTRPDIAAAKFKILFCHIPLFDPDPNADDGTTVTADGYAKWSRECRELWEETFVLGGVSLVIAGHQHQFRFDPATKDRPWAQIVGGGPECGFTGHGQNRRADSSRFPTVIEGLVENGTLRIKVHDVLNGRLALDQSFAMN